jgi:hypothetical protein
VAHDCFLLRAIPKIPLVEIGLNANRGRHFGLPSAVLHLRPFERKRTFAERQRAQHRKVHCTCCRCCNRNLFGKCALGLEQSAPDSEVRTTFVEAAMRSCLKTQLDAPTNKGVPVSALYDYCKCNASGMADNISNDEVKTLEATGSQEKYRTAMQSRLEASAKMCLEEIRKSLSK